MNDLKLVATSVKMTATVSSSNKKHNVDAEPVEVMPTKRSRLLVGVGIGVVGVVLVTGMILAAFYAGSMMHQNAYKAAWATLINADDPRQSMTEKVLIAGTEADVTRPGVIRFILDTANDYLTFLQDNPITTGHLSPCYVATVDVTGDLSSVQSKLSQEHVSETVSFSTNMHEFELSDQPVDLAQLSKRTQEMCFGRSVLSAFELTETDGGRVRRDGRLRLLWGLIDISWKRSKHRKSRKE